MALLQIFVKVGSSGNIKTLPGALSLGVRRPRCEADHLPPSSVEFKNAWSYTSTPPLRLHGVVLSESTGTTLPLSFAWFTPLQV
jgi:hypothetical protein